MNNKIIFGIAILFGVSGLILLSLDPRNHDAPPSTAPPEAVNEVDTDSVQPVTQLAPVTRKPVQEATPDFLPEPVTKEERQREIDKIARNPAEKKVIEEYFSKEDLQNAVRAYFDQQDALSEAERNAMAKQISDQLDMHEANGSIIPLEALSLRLALLKTTTSDSQYPELAQALTSKYQQRISETEPVFDTERAEIYKQEEAQILKEVQGMSSFPNGMTQSEYLRERLQELREEVYADDNQ